MFLFTYAAKRMLPSMNCDRLRSWNSIKAIGTFGFSTGNVLELRLGFHVGTVLELRLGVHVGTVLELRLGGFFSLPPAFQYHEYNSVQCKYTPSCSGLNSVLAMGWGDFAPVRVIFNMS